MTLLKIAVDERSEIVNKYKVLQMTLSKMHEHKEQNNELNEDETESFVPFKDLIKLRNKIFAEWEEKYENTPLKNIYILIYFLFQLIFLLSGIKSIYV